MKDLAEAWYSDVDFKVLWVQTLKQVQGDVKQVQGDAKRVQGDAKQVQGDAKRVQGDAKRVKVTKLGFRMPLKQVQGDVYSV
ncbi:MAG TPA: hypothetical protein PLA16_01745 [Chitinophagales bacterium]|nr:hypothetical protein [Chitinophagales bacterium]